MIQFRWSNKKSLLDPIAFESPNRRNRIRIVIIYADFGSGSHYRSPVGPAKELIVQFRWKSSASWPETFVDLPETEKVDYYFIQGSDLGGGRDGRGCRCKKGSREIIECELRGL